MIIKDNLSKGIKPYNSDYSKYIKDIKVDIDLIYTKDYNLIKRKCDKNRHFRPSNAPISPLLLIISSMTRFNI